MLGIVVSRADEASVHVGDQLRAVADWTAQVDEQIPDEDGGGTVYRNDRAEIRSFDGLHIELDRPADVFTDVDLIAFASRHSGETGPLLTVHHTGNVGPAEFGGEPNAVAEAAPRALAATLEAFESLAPEHYDTGIECTHHGPTDVGVPSLFVEVGSDQSAWQDPAATRAVANAILALAEVEPHSDRVFVGFGGGHYAPQFTRIVRETDWTVGHIAADWGLRAAGTLDDRLLEQLFNQSGTNFAVIDGEYPKLADRIEELGYRVVGESWLRETTGVPLNLVDQFEDQLSSIEAGLRFGRPARLVEQPSATQTVEPATDLLADANGIDAEQVRNTVADNAVVFETTDSGTRVNGRMVVAERDAWLRIESAIIDLLRDRYHAVRTTENEIIVTERAFDPDQARAFGVEPGPAFGELANGESVTVGSDVVEPEAVHETRTRRYPR